MCTAVVGADANAAAFALGAYHRFRQLISFTERSSSKIRQRTSFDLKRQPEIGIKETRKCGSCNICNTQWGSKREN